MDTTQPTSPPPKPQFTNPYEGAPIIRVAYFTSRSDHEFLFRTLHPGHNSLTTVYNMLQAKLVKALREAKITNHATQRMEFEKFMVECEIKAPKVKVSKSKPSTVE